MDKRQHRSPKNNCDYEDRCGRNCISACKKYNTWFLRSSCSLTPQAQILQIAASVAERADHGPPDISDPAVARTPLDSDPDDTRDQTEAPPSRDFDFSTKNTYGLQSNTNMVRGPRCPHEKSTALPSCPVVPWCHCPSRCLLFLRFPGRFDPSTSLSEMPCAVRVPCATRVSCRFCPAGTLLACLFHTPAPDRKSESRRAPTRNECQLFLLRLLIQLQQTIRGGAAFGHQDYAHASPRHSKITSNSVRACRFRVGGLRACVRAGSVLAVCDRGHLLTA